MSRGLWKPKSDKEADRMMAVAEARGYTVTQIERLPDGTVRLGLQRPGTDDPEELRKNL